MEETRLFDAKLLKVATTIVHLLSKLRSLLSKDLCVPVVDLPMPSDESIGAKQDFEQCGVEFWIAGIAVPSYSPGAGNADPWSCTTWRSNYRG
jgi:hypothetical protein